MTEQLESAQLKHIPTRLWVRFLQTYVFHENMNIFNWHKDVLNV